MNSTEPKDTADPISDLLNYVNKTSALEVDEEMQIDSNLQDFKAINLSIISLGLPSLGDFSNLPKSEIKQTNECLRNLLTKLNEQISENKNLLLKHQEFEQNQTKNIEILKQNQQKIEEKDKEIEKLKTLIKQGETNMKKEKENFAEKNEEMLRKCSQIISAQTVYQNEIKKKDKEISKLQDCLVKYKQISGPNIEITTPLLNTVGYNKNGEDTLVVTLTKGYEENIAFLKSEIKIYQDLFANIQMELEQFGKIHKIPSSSDPEFTKLSENLFSFPSELASDKILEIFRDNLSKLKSHISQYDLLSKPVNITENLSKISEILSGYTQLAKTQAQSVSNLCSTQICSGTYKILGDQSFENMWKIISKNKKILEENRKLINEEKSFCENRFSCDKLSTEIFSTDHLQNALTQNLHKNEAFVSPSFGNTQPLSKKQIS